MYCEYNMSFKWDFFYLKSRDNWTLISMSYFINSYLSLTLLVFFLFKIGTYYKPQFFYQNSLVYMHLYIDIKF